MDMKELRATAKEKLKGFCRVCPVCDGRACAGQVPGMGGIGTGQGFQANVQALAACTFNLRTIHEHKDVNTSSILWDNELDLPVLGAPMTGTTYNMGGQITEQDFARDMALGCCQAGTMTMIGDGGDPAMYESGLAAITQAQGKGIAIIKPRAQEEIIKRIRMAEKAGARAVGMDIDGAGLVTMALMGQAVGPKSIAEISELVASTTLPFILKGIMTVDEAERAVQTGAAGIVVSNHGGRVLDHTPGAAEVLPEIAAAVGHHITIMADGGVRTGSDVLKLLALGAHAVLLGRPLVTGVLGGGAEGVATILQTMHNQLIQAMLLTGTSDVSRVSPTILRGRA
jgi:isopentenyl diphosphate isomerase/L-lactate dehydrogenase-like FMN-dependent dehydrogenase